MSSTHDFLPLNLPQEILSGWQSAADVMAEVTDAPIGLITRLRGGDLEIIISSRTPRNPFRIGEELRLLGSGSYCEEVVRVRGLLRVTDARKTRAWRNAPPALEGFRAYMGLPLFLPGGHTFGTISVLDVRPHPWRAMDEALMFRFRDLVESQLSLLLLNRDQRERARLLATYRDELKQLREVFPICPRCRQIRDDTEYWDAVEEYFVSHAMGEFGHGLCPDCAEKHWGESIVEPEPVPLPRGLGMGTPAKA